MSLIGSCCEEARFGAMSTTGRMSLAPIRLSELELDEMGGEE